MVIPREHGAWGMLLVPLATGAVVALRTGINGGALTLFIVAAMSLFWLRTPVESWLGTSAIKAQTEQERAFVLRMIAGIGCPGRSQCCGVVVEWPESRPAGDRRRSRPWLLRTSGCEKTRDARAACRRKSLARSG